MEFRLDGSRVTDLASFYAEVNRVLMVGEGWQLGQSLDALNDLLYGGLGVLVNVENPVIVFDHSDQMRQALGVEATRRWYEAKLAQPGRFNTDAIASQLAALNAGDGPTYFELVLQVFADHPNIELRLE